MTPESRVLELICLSLGRDDDPARLELDASDSMIVRSFLEGLSEKTKRFVRESGVAAETFGGVPLRFDCSETRFVMPEEESQRWKATVVSSCDLLN